MVYEKKGVSGLIWSPKKDAPLVRIKQGRAETGDKAVAIELEKRGFVRIDKDVKKSHDDSQGNE